MFHSFIFLTIRKNEQLPTRVSKFENVLSVLLFLLLVFDIPFYKCYVVCSACFYILL